MMLLSISQPVPWSQPTQVRWNLKKLKEDTGATQEEHTHAWREHNKIVYLKVEENKEYEE